VGKVSRLSPVLFRKENKLKKIFVFIFLFAIAIISLCGFKVYGTEDYFYVDSTYWNYDFNYDTHVTKLTTFPSGGDGNYYFMAITIGVGNDETICPYSTVSFNKWGILDYRYDVFAYILIPDSLLYDMENKAGDDPSPYINIRVYDQNTTADYYNDTFEHYMSAFQINPNSNVKIIKYGANYLFQFRLSAFNLINIPSAVFNGLAFSVTTTSYYPDDISFIYYGLSNVVVKLTSTDELFVHQDAVFRELFIEYDTSEAYDLGYSDARKIFGYYNINWYTAGQRYTTGYDTGQDDMYDHGSDAYGTYDPSSSFDYGAGLTAGAASEEVDLMNLGYLMQGFFRTFNVLSIQILPNITIGMIIGVPLMLGLLSFIIGVATFTVSSSTRSNMKGRKKK